MMKLTKSHIVLILACLAGLLFAGCLQMPAGVLQPGTEGLYTQLGGKVKLTTASATLESDMQKSFKDGSDVLKGSIRDWLISKVLLRGLDSMDASTASDEALAKAEINGKTEAAKIASAEKIRLEELAMEAAEMEAATAIVPVP